jgi:hypothetical protein
MRSPTGSVWSCKPRRKLEGQCDRILRRLKWYIDATEDIEIMGWCGDKSDTLDLKVYADAHALCGPP